jgi:peptidoglycan/LPS O-acetylase OafA/YrhL
MVFALGVVLAGAAVIVIGSGYSMGAMSEPGPGLFPVVLGSLLVALGLAIVSGDEMPGSGAVLRFRPMVFVCAAILAWALLVERLGFVPATLALVALSACAERRIRPMPIAILAVVLCVGGLAAFVYGFRMPFEAFRW